MSRKWRNLVKPEYIKTDRDFTEKLPLESINLSTFGLISEATTFAPVRDEDGEIHIRPLQGGLSELRKDLKNSPRPGGNFNLDQAISALTQFAEEWEKSIKEKNKWKEMINLAEEEGSVVDHSELAELTENRGSFLSKIKNIFKS